MKKLLLFLFLIPAVLFGQHQYIKSIPASGTNTYSATVTVPTWPGSYTNTVLNIKFANANTGASTLKVNGGSDIDLRMWDGDSWELLTGGELDVNTVYTVKYQGSYFEVFGAGTSGSSFTLTDGNATTANGTSVDVGGAATNNIDINISGFAWTTRHGASGPRFYLDNDKFYADANNSTRYLEIGGVSDNSTLANEGGTNPTYFTAKTTGAEITGDKAELAGGALSVSTGNSIATKNYADTKQPQLTITAEKTTSYTASANEFVPADLTSGNFVLTLPNAPADGTRVGAKIVKPTSSIVYTYTVNTAGSDVFNRSGGSTSATLSMIGQAQTYQYKASSGIWYVVSDDEPLSQLDSRFTLEKILTTSNSAANLNITNLADGASAQDAVNKRQLDAATSGLNLQPLNSQTGSNYTFVLGDAGKIVDRDNASANTATIPPNSSVSFSNGTYLCICEKGAGISSFAPGSGVTINPSAGAGNYQSLGKNNGIGIPTCARKISTNTWELINGLPAATVRSNIYANNFLPRIAKGSTRNRWYGSGITCATTTTQGVSANTLYAWPFIVSERLTITDIQASVGTGVSATSFRIGIYADDGTCYPGSLLYGTSSLSSATSSTIRTETLTSSITIDPGLYWLSIISDGTPVFKAWNTGSIPLILGWDASMTGTQPIRGFQVSHSFGALPSTFDAGASYTSSSVDAHMILVRAQ